MAKVDGSSIGAEVTVMALKSAEDPPDDMSPVGPVYDVVPSRPLGPVVLTLALPTGVDPTQVVIARAGAQGWEILGGLPTEDGRVSAVVDHFSRITAFLSSSWSTAVGLASDVKRLLGLGSIGDPPRCDASNAQAVAKVSARYIGDQVSEKNFRVDVCAERTGSKARLKLVNRRAVAVRIQAPQAVLKERTIPGLGDIVSIGMSTLSRALGGPNEGALIPPGGQIVLEFDDVPQQFDMSVDNSGIVWSVLFAAAAAVQGGWQALGEAANAIDATINVTNTVRGKGWEDLARQGLGEFFKALSRTAVGALKVVLRVGAALVATVILAIRGTIDSFLGLAGNSIASLAYTPGVAPQTLGTGSPLTASGLGPVKLGMTVEEARTSSKLQLVYRPPSPSGVLCGLIDLPVSDTRTILQPSRSGPNVIVEIVTRNRAVQTDKGVHVGSTAADVFRAYPSATQVNSHYSEALVVNSGPNALVFRFRVGTGRPITETAIVEDISATLTEYVRFEELCS